jgi:peroxiredoxin Q/BCP
VRDEIGQYRNASVQPFGVNFAGIESHHRYAEKLKLPFPLLSDPGRETIGAYGALKKDGKKIQRTVVLVDLDGTVAFAARGMPGADESLKNIKN